MRYGILADVHANPDALQAVFDDAKGRRVGAWWFLGDAVGYGPQPVEVLGLLRQRIKPEHWLIGNHDAMLVGLLEADVREEVDDTLSHHKQLLSMDTALWDWCHDVWTVKRAQPRSLRTRRLNAWLVHGSLPQFGWQEALMQYIFPWPDRRGVDNLYVAVEELRKLSKLGVCNLLIHGHTHIPYAWGWRKDSRRGEFLPICYPLEPGRGGGCVHPQPLSLDDFDHLLICPGSVGQPRNPDPEAHAAYGILDTGQRTFEFQRIVYDSEPVRHRMIDEGYPKNLQLMLMGAGRRHPFWGDGKMKKNWAWIEWDRLYGWDHGCGWTPVDGPPEPE